MSDTQVRSESGPTWLISEPVPPYHEERFDTATPPLNPQQPTPYVCYVCGKETNDAHTNHEGEDVCADCCDVCKNERIAIAAYDALDNIETVFLKWGYIQTYPLLSLRALRDLLAPPAPKWEPRKGGDF